MTTQEIHDMIQTTEAEPTQETIRRILSILDAINEHIRHAESAAYHASNTASCLANGIRPD